MTGLPTLYYREGPRSERCKWCGYGSLVLITEPLLTREEAANAMMAFLNEHGGDVGQHWPTTEGALKWLEGGDESA